MTQPVAVALVLALVLVVVGLSISLIWGIAKQIARARDEEHAKALRTQARRLLEAGYGEAAEHFQAYAEDIEERLLSKRKQP